MRTLQLHGINLDSCDDLSYPIHPKFKLLPLLHRGMSIHAMACHMKYDWLATFLANEWSLCMGFVFELNFTQIYHELDIIQATFKMYDWPSMVQWWEGI